MPRQQPNVVLFVTHDTGQHVSPYGIPAVRTPNCERLARQGVRFENSFCTSPLCSPSRASLVTGRYIHQNGVMGLTGQRTGLFDLFPGEKHAARLFQDAGYETCLCGFEHETPFWQEAGFQQAISGTGGWFNGGGDLRDHAGEIDRWLKVRDAGRPFYMQIGCHETHREWQKFGTPPDDSLGVWMPPYLRELPELRAEMGELQGAVRRLDECLGAILDVLDGHGLHEDTIFVLTTDHGIDIPRAKGTFYDPGIEVMLFMRYPAGGWGQGRTLELLISNVDVLPTLLEASGIAVPENVEGRSFLPLLQGLPYEPNEHVFAEKVYHDTYDPTRAVRTARHKYIRYFEVCIFQDLRIATIPRWSYFKERPVRSWVEELYDLQSDPREEHNLAEEPDYEDIKRNMRRRLLGWMRRTDDPQLEGPVESPYYRAMREEFIQEGNDASD